MTSDWKEYKLSNIIHILGGGTPKTTIQEYWNGNIPWLSISSVVSKGGLPRSYIAGFKAQTQTLGSPNVNQRVEFELKSEHL